MSMLKGLLKPKTKSAVPSAPGAPMPGVGGAATTAAPAAGFAGSGSLTGGGDFGRGSRGAIGVDHERGTAAMASVDPTPRADVALPHAHHRRERRRSSIIREEKSAALKDLPSLKEAPAAKREALFKQKLAIASVEFNWDDPESDKRGKELKRNTLLELVDYVNSPNGQKIFTETVMEDVVNMVTSNIFRTLPPPASPAGGEEVTGIAGGEDGEEEPYLEPAWPHLQLVYEFLLRFIVSGEVKAKSAKKYIDTVFCARLIEMFDCEDPRERDYLKTILHRIYGKFMSHRSFVRKAIANVFYRFVYETDRHNGVAELLEILGSIINGFALPLKPEHVQFLEKALIPLHRPRGLQAYFQTLCYCVTQYVEKDPTTAVLVINGLVKTWPWSSSAKQITLLNELEEVLELAGPEAVQPVVRPLFRTLARCVGSTHFQVAERALFLWNNEHLLTHGILSRVYAPEVLPLLYSSLMKNASGHWNTTVETLAANVLKHYQEADPALYDKCAQAATEEPQVKAKAVSDKKSKWAAVERLAAAAAASGASSGSYAEPVAAVVAATPGIAGLLPASSGTSSGRVASGAGHARLSVSTLNVLAASL